MKELTQSQADFLLAQPLAEIKKFISGHTAAPVLPEWAERRSYTPTRAQILALRSGIMDHIHWDSTPQGGAYWSEVHTNLGSLAAELPKEKE